MRSFLSPVDLKHAAYLNHQLDIRDALISMSRNLEAQQQENEQQSTLRRWFRDCENFWRIYSRQSAAVPFHGHGVGRKDQHSAGQ
jgi:hypothetical protein